MGSIEEKNEKKWGWGEADRSRRRRLRKEVKEEKRKEKVIFRINEDVGGREEMRFRDFGQRRGVGREIEREENDGL
jgi:hypothetical protein